MTPWDLQKSLIAEIEELLAQMLLKNAAGEDVFGVKGYEQRLPEITDDEEDQSQLGFKFHPNKTTIRKSIMLRISRKARTIARAAYASIRNAHAMVSYIGYIVNSDSQHFYEKWVRPFVNIKHLKGVIADEDRKQHQACVAV